MTAEMMHDDAMGRVLDRIYAYGTWKILSAVCMAAFRSFGVDTSVIHQDTTSFSVWGECRPEPGDPTSNSSSSLCCASKATCHAGILDGNASDKKTNGMLLTELPRIMAAYGEKEYLYVADSALVTEENLSRMQDGISFVSRLPENFGSCGRLISEAVARGSWEEHGQLSHRMVRGKNLCASYRLQEQSVELYGRLYRAIVVHSDAHDRRRQKRIDRIVEKDAKTTKNKALELDRKEFFCLPDAEAAALTSTGPHPSWRAVPSKRSVTGC